VHNMHTSLTPQSITAPHSITPEWLTQALRFTDTVKNARVDSVTVEPIAVGQGFTSQLARLRLTYTSFQVDAPRTLICKLPTLYNPTLSAARKFGVYQREVRFYQEMAAQIPIRTARPFFSWFDADTGNFILLLEDLAPARPGDQVAGCSIAEAELAISNAAVLHSRWWNDPDLCRYPWLVNWNANADFAQQSYTVSCINFLRT